MHTDFISRFEELKLSQTISFCAHDTDEKGHSIQRSGIVKFIDSRKKEITIERISGPPQPTSGEEEKSPMLHGDMGQSSEEETW